MNDLDELNSSFLSAINKLNANEDPKQYKAYLVIPNAGCDGCISDAENVLKNTIKTALPVRFVLTNIVSMKMIKLKLGIDVANNPKILLDTSNLFNRGILRSIYPKVFLMNSDGQVAKEVDVSPDEDGLGALIGQLNKKNG